MDDYKDKDTDDVEANYILKNGLTKSKELYLDCKKNLLILLNNNNIATNELIDLINLIDQKFEL